MTRLIVIFIGGCILCACGDEDTKIIQDYPPTFGDECEVDAGMCEAPFSCLGNNDYFFCTRTCQVTEDCPWMVMSGHCSGRLYAACDEGGLLEGLCVVSACQ